MICILGEVYLERTEGKGCSTIGGEDGCNFCQFVLLFFHTVIAMCKSETAFGNQSSGTT